MINCQYTKNAKYSYSVVFPQSGRVYFIRNVRRTYLNSCLASVKQRQYFKIFRRFPPCYTSAYTFSARRISNKYKFKKVNCNFYITYVCMYTQ